jgi:hypothetical protein
MRFRGLVIHSKGTWELVDGYGAEGGFYDRFFLPPYGKVNPDGLVQEVEANPPSVLEIWLDSKYFYDFYSDIRVTPHSTGFYALTGALPTGIQIVQGRGNGLITIASLTGVYTSLVHRTEKWCEPCPKDISCL